MRRGGWAIHMIPGLFGPTKKASIAYRCRDP